MYFNKGENDINSHRYFMSTIIKKCQNLFQTGIYLYKASERESEIKAWLLK